MREKGVRVSIVSKRTGPAPVEPRTLGLYSNRHSDERPLHSGDAESCRAFLGRISTSYVYVLRRPDGRPFYVGKGGGGINRFRALEHENEAKHPNLRGSNAYKLNVIRSVWRSGKAVGYEIDSTHNDELSAYMREAELIQFYKRLHEGGSLTNLAPGGGADSGISPFSKEKHSETLAGIPADDPERATVNGFVLSIYPSYAKRLSSVPIKPASQHQPKPTTAHAERRTAQTVRQAVALAASAAANGIMIDGVCEIPRTMNIDSVPAIIESGVARDIATSGLANVRPATNAADECFLLSELQGRVIVEFVGYEKCLNLGLVRQE